MSCGVFERAEVWGLRRVPGLFGGREEHRPDGQPRSSAEQHLGAGQLRPFLRPKPLREAKPRPGIANFSSLYQQSGWLPPTFLVLVCVASSIFSGASRQKKPSTGRPLGQLNHTQRPCCWQQCVRTQTTRTAGTLCNRVTCRDFKQRVASLYVSRATARECQRMHA